MIRLIASKKKPLSPRKAAASKSAGKATEAFVGGFLYRWKQYAFALSVGATSFIIEIPDVWIYLGDVITSLDFTGLDGVPKWFPWAIRAVAILIGTAHKLKKDVT